MTHAQLRDASLETLIGYIVGRYHARVRKVIPSILANAEQAAQVDGVLHPDLEFVAERVAYLMVEMLVHMRKEETVLFPYIGSVAIAVRKDLPLPDSSFESLEDLLGDLENDHEAVFDAMGRIRELTKVYTAPGDVSSACHTCLKSLESFERELAEHIQIEREVLFPKVRALAAPAFT